MSIDSVQITGKNPLNGQIQSSGAKNAVTKLLVASLISNKKCVFYNVPNIGDVEITLALCREVGMQASWDRKAKCLEVITPELKTTTISQQFSGANRIPILILGALLGRTGEEICVPTLGGDHLGSRPLDFHIRSLQNLGAIVEYRESPDGSSYFAKAPDGGMQGTLIVLPYPSVGATENCILAGVKAKGLTVIKNAAIEPEIIDLILFLQKLGVDITVDADRTIRLQYTDSFSEVEHTIMTDRNEVASYALAAISTKGRVFIKDAQHVNMIVFLNKLRKAGGGFTIRNDGIEFFYQGGLNGGLHIETDVHPGFMTDWQQLFGVLLTQCRGSSVIHETVYEKRFGYTATLQKMGADIELFDKCLGGKNCRFASLGHKHSIIIKGPTPLFAQNISIPDLRAGFAYVIAALIAEGTSIIDGMHFLERGYDEPTAKLASLGADIKPISSSKSLLSKLIKQPAARE